MMLKEQDINGLRKRPATAAVRDNSDERNPLVGRIKWVTQRKIVSDSVRKNVTLFLSDGSDIC